MGIAFFRDTLAGIEPVSVAACFINDYMLLFFNSSHHENPWGFISLRRRRKEEKEAEKDKGEHEKKPNLL